MKILQVISSFSPAYSYGGPVKMAFNISKELVKNNHHVTVYTTDVYDSNSRLDYKINPEIMDGITVYRFRNLSNYLSRKNLTCAPSMLFYLKNQIKKFDVIHLHEYRSFQAIFAYYYAQKYNIPYIIQARGSVLPFFEKQFLKQAFDVIWGNRILANSACCIALTKTESDQYFRRGVPENKIVIIPNGLDLSQFSNLPERGTFRSKYGISPTEKIILFLGRIHKIKGIDLLIEAYADLLNEIPNARLVIAGPDDNFLSALQKQIRELKPGKMPLFTGPLYNQEKLAAYVDADVYVLPSRYEIFGNTILESWACGTPVIVTTGCHIADVVEKAGIVVERDPVELAEAIKKIVLDEVLREKFADTGKAMVNNEFNLEAVVDNIEACYRQVIDNIKND